MICPNCGANIDSESVFCEVCGANVYDPYGDQTQPYPGRNGNSYPPQQPSQKKNDKVIIAAIAGAVAVIAIIAIVVIVFAGKSDTKDDDPEPETTTQSTIQEATQSPQNFEVTAATTEVTAATTEATTQPPTTQPEQTTQAPTAPSMHYADPPAQSSGQILFDSANQYITEAYLSRCSRDEVTIILNEMYARHGYIFKDAELREYFNQQGWYTGTTTSMETAASRFNSIEKANLNTISNYMKKMGWR